METFLQAYIACAFWASVGDTTECLDDTHGEDDLAPKTLASMTEDCKNFQETYKRELANAYKVPGYTEAQAGHDFWLTRNGHGAGFWDRGLGKLGERLTQAAKLEGGCDLYVGDDGKVYL